VTALLRRLLTAARSLLGRLWAGGRAVIGPDEDSAERAEVEWRRQRRRERGEKTDEDT